MTRVTTTNPLADDLDRILARTAPLWDELRGGRILITGATGFFGCWLLESFAWINDRLNLGARAVAMSRHPESLVEKVPHLAEVQAITTHAGDVRTSSFPDGSFTHIIHAATEASAVLNERSPLSMFDTNVEGTRRVLEFAAKAGARKFLLTSSGAVYGTQPPHITHVSESYLGGPDSLDKNSAYSEGKRAAETLCALHASETLNPKIARCFAFVGPYMKLRAHFAIGNFIADRISGGPITVKGDGSPFRSYMYASDLMVWLWTILMSGMPCRAYNVGSEEAISVGDVAHMVAAALPPKVSVEIKGMAQPGGMQYYVPSTARARDELGLTSTVPLTEGIRRTYDWFVQAGAHV